MQERDRVMGRIMPRGVHGTVERIGGMRRIAPSLACALAARLFLAGGAFGMTLPLPEPGIPDNPRLQPTVVTAGGRRLLLNHTDLKVRYDRRRRSLVVDRPGWWVINFPLKRIENLEGRTEDEIARLLFGRPLKDVRNWYVKTPGRAAAEPATPTGPAPIDLTPDPTLIVDNRHRRADDANPGTAAEPLRTITAAVERAGAGAVIHVCPGTYRESVVIKKSGTAGEPIRLEGIRGKDGRMPVITGNDVFPPDSWKRVHGLRGVYRADIFTRRLGTVSAAGRTLIERSIPGELKEGECCLNRASKEFLNLRFERGIDPREGQRSAGKAWRLLRVDNDGFLDLRKAYEKEAGNAVFWASTYVYVEPKQEKNVVWNPDFPEVISGRLHVEGDFCGFRRTQLSVGSQRNKNRVWANGKLLPSVMHKEWQPHPDRNTGHWEGFPLREGWNHLIFQFDTTTGPDKTRFRFGVPRGVDKVVTSAARPPDRTKPGSALPRPHVAEYLVLGPFPSDKDMGVYVRLPGNADPNTVTMDLAAQATRKVRVEGDFVQVRGFEIRHGAQYQQRGLVGISGQGTLLEGCLLHGSEVNGIGFGCQKDQKAAPMVIRNNWVIDPGNLGIGGSGDSKKLTPGNQNGLVPGRSPVLIDYNVIVNNNSGGYSAGWEAGGMKVFKLTGSVIRYNTVIGGNGPGIWLDWAHYNNRVEGNLLRNTYGYGVGVEASPGPNLIANNLSVDLRPAYAWSRAAILSWDSDRTWAVNNTVDGCWNPHKGWQGYVGTEGICLGMQPTNRSTRWGVMKGRKDLKFAYINNIVVGCGNAIAWGMRDSVAANITDRGAGTMHLDTPPSFVNPEGEDYRVRRGSPINNLGVGDEYAKLVRHDFYGLIRHPDAGRSVGAFRLDPEPSATWRSVIEVEFEDGTVKRLYATKPFTPARSYNIMQADRVYALPHVGVDWKGKPEHLLDGRPLWRVSWHDKGNTLTSAVGLNKAGWGGLMVWDEKGKLFKDPLDGLASLSTGKGHYRWCKAPGHHLGSRGRARPILSFIAPRGGKYLLYTQHGWHSIWGGHSTLALNVVRFAKGSEEGKSVHYFQAERGGDKPMRLNLLVEMREGDELALVQDANASGGGGGAVFGGYQFKVGYFAE